MKNGIFFLILFLSLAVWGDKPNRKIAQDVIPIPVDGYIFSLSQDQNKRDLLTVVGPKGETVCAYHADAGERFDTVNLDGGPVPFTQDPHRYFLISWTLANIQAPQEVKVLDVSQKADVCKFVASYSSLSINPKMVGEKLQIELVDPVDPQSLKKNSRTYICSLDEKKVFGCSADPEVKAYP